MVNASKTTDSTEPPPRFDRNAYADAVLDDDTMPAELRKILLVLSRHADEDGRVVIDGDEGEVGRALTRPNRAQRRAAARRVRKGGSR